MTRKIRVPVSNVDAAWLGMDESTNPMIINGVMLFSEALDYDKFLYVLRKRLVARFSRFSQRVAASDSPFHSLYWETDPHFDIRSQVHHLSLPDPGENAELQRLIGMLMSEPLDRTRPLWRAYLIDNYQGGCAVYVRLHHAIGDGIAIMRVILSLTDSQPGMRSRTAQSTNQRLSKDRSGILSSSKQTLTAATGALVRAAREADSNSAKVQEAAKLAMDAVVTTGVVTAAATANLAKLALMSRDRRGVYRGDLTPIKRIAWTEPLSLERVRAVGKATGTTINDVLVSAVTGGLRRYMIAVEGFEPNRDIRSTIPINLRASNEPLTLGNKFSLVFLTLPITASDAGERLQAVKERMDSLKHSTEPELVYQILNVLGKIPGPLARQTSAWFASKSTCIMTNVPGPSEPVYLADRRVEKILFWVPQTRGVGMGISILSYAGDVTIGLMVDDALVQKPGDVLLEVQAEFEELEQLAHSAQVAGAVER